MLCLGYRVWNVAGVKSKGLSPKARDSGKKQSNVVTGHLHFSRNEYLINIKILFNFSKLNPFSILIINNFQNLHPLFLEFYFDDSGLWIQKL